jgi:hypothetical protein
MTQQGWKEAVLKAADDHERGDDVMLELLSKLLEEVDDAKEQLRRKGYGCTGMPWRNMINEVPEAWQ